MLKFHGANLASSLFEVQIQIFNIAIFKNNRSKSIAGRNEALNKCKRIWAQCADECNPIKDDFLAKTTSSSNGSFYLDGSGRDILKGKIDPRLYIYHKCNKGFF
uniref:Uncharacterized protein n=1 Tax=Romanomermis culicivorax TaxID=13658 RepID=A0A915KEM9_ROMCU